MPLSCLASRCKHRASSARNQVAQHDEYVVESVSQPEPQSISILTFNVDIKLAGPNLR